MGNTYGKIGSKVNIIDLIMSSQNNNCYNTESGEYLGRYLDRVHIPQGNGKQKIVFKFENNNILVNPDDPIRLIVAKCTEESKNYKPSVIPTEATLIPIEATIDSSESKLDELPEAPIRELSQSELKKLQQQEIDKLYEELNIAIFANNRPEINRLRGLIEQKREQNSIPPIAAQSEEPTEDPAESPSIGRAITPAIGIPIIEGGKKSKRKKSKRKKSKRKY